METGFKHAMLGGRGLTDEKSYDAVSTKLSCKTCDKRLQGICIWFRNEPFLYGIYKFSFYRRLCPWRATLALGSSSQRVNTLRQELDRSPVPPESSEVLAAILWVGGGDGENKQSGVLGGFDFFFSFFFLRLSGSLFQVRFSLFVFNYCQVH